MGLAGDIREKVSCGALPPGIPPKVKTLFGDSRACSVCDQPIRGAQIRYEFEVPGFDAFRFHFGCFGLLKAELILRGWFRGEEP